LISQYTSLEGSRKTQAPAALVEATARKLSAAGLNSRKIGLRPTARTTFFLRLDPEVRSLFCFPNFVFRLGFVTDRVGNHSPQGVLHSERLETALRRGDSARIFLSNNAVVKANEVLLPAAERMKRSFFLKIEHANRGR
jgi:hypothetical protein